MSRFLPKDEPIVLQMQAVLKDLDAGDLQNKFARFMAYASAGVDTSSGIKSDEADARALTGERLRRLHASPAAAKPILCAIYPDQVVDFRRLTIEDVDFAYVAKRLARIPRFVGGTRDPYSVAQHSVFVCDACPRDVQPLALLHDAHEAFVSDITTPTKNLVAAIADEIDGSGETVRRAIKTATDRIDVVIYAAAGLSVPTDAQRAAIAEADAFAYRSEVHAFLDLSPDNLARIGLSAPTTPSCFRPLAWSAERAEQEFLRALRQYGII